VAVAAAALALLAGVLAFLPLAYADARRRWLAGAPARVDVAGGIEALPRRYLGDLHGVVARRPAVARAHAAGAGGFLASAVLVVVVAAVPAAFLLPAQVLLAIAAVVAVAGAWFFGARRWFGRAPANLSRNWRWSALPASLLAFALAALCLAVAGPTVVPTASVAAVLALAAVLASALLGPLRHAWLGALHLAFHPRPERFGLAASGPQGALTPLDLDAPKLGAEAPRDFAWNRLLGFDACVQCGRCELACPAFAAGQPLNPKKLIQDLATALGPGEATDAAYAGSPHPGLPVGTARGGPGLPLVGPGAMIHPDTVWACTTCRACVHECPMFIEHVDAVVDLRRFQTLELGAVPAKAAPALAELREGDTVSGRPLARRLDWAADLGLRHLGEGEGCDVLLWVGEGGFELRNQRTLRALAKLLRRAGLDVAVLGEAELDSGDLARRLGDEATFQRLAAANVTTLLGRRFRRIVTADPHSFHALRNEYPAFGGTFEVLHHTQLLAGLVADGRLAVPAPASERLSPTTTPATSAATTGRPRPPGHSSTRSASSASRWSATGSAPSAAAGAAGPRSPTCRAPVASLTSEWTRRARRVPRSWPWPARPAR
jgi:Fe-S oxidoreductase